MRTLSYVIFAVLIAGYAAMSLPPLLLSHLSGITPIYNVGAVASAAATMVGIYGDQARGGSSSTTVKKRSTCSVCYMLLNLCTRYMVLRAYLLGSESFPHPCLTTFSTVIIALSSVIIEHKANVNHSSFYFAAVILSLSCLVLTISLAQLIWAIRSLCRSDSSTEVNIHVHEPFPQRNNQPSQQLNQPQEPANEPSQPLIHQPSPISATNQVVDNATV